MATVVRAEEQAHADGEQELVRAIRHGDDRAFEHLYARYRNRISAYILSMVGDHGRAEDIAQDVFISALRRLRASDQPVTFKPWLYEIAKNACIDEFRRRSRAREISLDGEDRARVYGLPSLSLSPDAAIESKQRLADLRGAFRGLSESHHRILVLRELEGLSYHQIGDRLGMTKPVVESTLFRARRRLGEEFEDLESGRRCARVQELIDAQAALPSPTLGLRDRRLVARHLSHCEPCRRARLTEFRDQGPPPTPAPALPAPRPATPAPVATRVRESDAAPPQLVLDRQISA
jgi:RNA polymerase sigma factor (sigma-70 family)